MVNRNGKFCNKVFHRLISCHSIATNLAKKIWIVLQNAKIFKVAFCKSMAELSYRPDVDGLRAVAVLSVVVFHAFPSALPGGFVGVDVFFVISGFLISNILFVSLRQRRFSILSFYDKRVRRIFPALIVVMVFSLAFGWKYLFSDEYRQVGKHIASGVGFVTNIVLWQESGYFDVASETKPMLHLWSLAIEEQFYLFWPLLLAFLWRRKINFLYIMGFIALASFAFNVYLIKYSPTASFYSPLTRFWELMVGGILAYVTLQGRFRIERYRSAASIAGGLLLLAGFVFINKSRQFPGWWALLPTAGAFLLILSGPDAWVNRRILSLRAVVFIGLISYPLYLWHWPLLSFAKIMLGSTSREIRLLLVATAVLLAWVTYKWIEKPLRFNKWPKMMPALVSIFAAVGFAGFSCVKTEGYEGYGPRDAAKTEFLRYFDNSVLERSYLKREGLREKYREQCNFYDLAAYYAGHSSSLPVAAIDAECYVRDRAIPRSLFIWGDSHASHLYFGLKLNLSQDWQILQVTSSACAPSLSYVEDSATNYCQRSNWFALKTIGEQKPDIVIVAQEANHSVQNMASIEDKIKKLGVSRVLFMGPAPHWEPAMPKLMVRKFWDERPQRTFVGLNDKFMSLDEKIKKTLRILSSDNYVSLFDYFCNQSGCLTRLGPDIKLHITSWDYGHLTPVASDAFARDVLVPLIYSETLQRLP